MASEKDLIADVIEAENQVRADFEEKWEEAKRNAEIFGLKHWTKAEEDALKTQGRIPYRFDKNSHAIGTALGTQRDSRFDIFFFEREESDAPRAEVFNQVWKYFSDKFDFIHVESDVFQDGLICKYGAYGCEITKDFDIRGDLKIFRVPYTELIWDKNFREYSLSDAYWMNRMRFFQRNELKRRFAKDKAKVELIERAGLDTDWSERKVKIQNWFKPDKDLIATREYFERDWLTRYFIWQNGSEDPEIVAYETEKQAKSEIERRNQLIDSAILSGQFSPTQKPSWEIIEIPQPCIKRSEVIINGVLEEPTILELGDFPYTIYFPYFHDGEFWSLQDRLKDPQLFVNREFAQIDHWIGTMAKGLLVGDSRIPDKEWQKIVEAFGKTGGAIRTRYADSIKVIESKGPAPQLFTMLEAAIKIMEDSMGGANIQGLKETASESGRAVLARQAQAGLDMFVCLDNMRRTKQNLGVKIAWYLTNEISAPRKLRIVGNTMAMQAMMQRGIMSPHQTKPNVGYLEINTTPENSISQLEVDIVVDEAAHSATKNMTIINQLTDAFKSGLIQVPLPPQAAIPLFNLPTEVEQAWLQAAQAATEAGPEPKPPSLSVNYKDLPPDGKIQAAQQAGIQLEPGGVLTQEILTKPHLTKQEEGARANK